MTPTTLCRTETVRFRQALVKVPTLCVQRTDVGQTVRASCLKETVDV